MPQGAMIRDSNSWQLTAQIHGMGTEVRRIGAIPGIDDLAMTSNGTLLAPLAARLRQAGLQRINISLDALDPFLGDGHPLTGPGPKCRGKLRRAMALLPSGCRRILRSFVGSSMPPIAVLSDDPLQILRLQQAPLSLKVVQDPAQVLLLAVNAASLSAAIVDHQDPTRCQSVIQILRGMLPGLPLLALTDDTGLNSRIALMAAGASSVLAKPCSGTEALSSITALQEMATVDTSPDNLASREREVFNLLGEGFAPSEIAIRQNINVKAVEGTILRLRSKLDCTDTAILGRLVVIRKRHAMVNEISVTGTASCLV